MSDKEPEDAWLKVLNAAQRRFFECEELAGSIQKL